MMKLLEVLNETENRAAIFPAVVLLVLLGRYLSREAIRRGIHPLKWHLLPPSMNLALAMFIFDFGVTIRYVATAFWYARGENIATLLGVFNLAIGIMIVGLLCKIKAITEPEYGRWPWFFTMTTVLAIIFVLLATR